MSKDKVTRYITTGFLIATAIVMVKESMNKNEDKELNEEEKELEIDKANEKIKTQVNTLTENVNEILKESKKDIEINKSIANKENMLKDKIEAIDRMQGKNIEYENNRIKLKNLWKKYGELEEKTLKGIANVQDQIELQKTLEEIHYIQNKILEPINK